jgi:hypothetical protein
MADLDLLTTDRPIPLGGASAAPVAPPHSQPAAAPAGPPQRYVPPAEGEHDRPPAAADDHPLAALRGFRFEVEGGAAALNVGRHPAVGRFLAAYLLVAAIVVALIAGFLLLAGAGSAHAWMEAIR